MAKRKGNGNGEGGLDRVVAPVASAVILAGAFANTVVNRVKAKNAEDAEAEANAEPNGETTAATAATSAEDDCDVEDPGGEPVSGEASRPEFTGIKGKLAKYPALRFLLEFQDRYSQVKGNNVAAAVTFQMFLSLFPLMLVIVGVLGFIAAGSHTDIAGKIINDLGLTGEGAAAIHNAVATAEKSRKAASIIGLAGLLWSGLGLVNALQYAYNQVWQVEERGVKDKAVGVGWLLGAALIFLIAGLATSAVRLLPGFLASLGVVVGLGVNFALWLWTAKMLPNRDVGWRALVPGAIFGAVGMELLKIVGAFYVPRLVANSSELYGSLGVVFAVLAWLLIFARLIIYSATLNVLLYERKRGTVRTTIEVPRVPQAKPDETSRSGRVEKEDIAA